jgi:GNAT superfamily N-acetyltransferase
MPKVRRQSVPPALLEHLLDRVRQRAIPYSELEALARWLDTQPEVPAGRWYKRFPGMNVCGEGGLVKTLLTIKQVPVGEEVR